MNAPKQQLSSCPNWEEVREELRKVVTDLRGEMAFTTWFEGAVGRVEEVADGLFTLRIASPSKVHTTWLQDNFIAIIELVWRRYAPEGKIIFTE